MNQMFEDFTIDRELTPELIQFKNDLDQRLEAELDKIESNKAISWVAKQKYAADIKSSYEDTWEQHLTDAGYVIRPVFESLKKDTFEDWYEQLNKINS